MIDKVIRIFNIINAIQANLGISAADLALKCDVNIRTIYRDLDVLPLIDPVTNEKRGTGYRFMGKFFLYPLNFTEQEALALSLLPSVLEMDKLPPGFDTAYDKVMGTPAYCQESPNFLQPVIQALLEKRMLHTIYHTQYREENDGTPCRSLFPRSAETRAWSIGRFSTSGQVRGRACTSLHCR